MILMLLHNTSHSSRGAASQRQKAVKSSIAARILDAGGGWHSEGVRELSSVALWTWEDASMHSNIASPTCTDCQWCRVRRTANPEEAPEWVLPSILLLQERLLIARLWWWWVLLVASTTRLQSWLVSCELVGTLSCLCWSITTITSHPSQA